MLRLFLVAALFVTGSIGQAGAADTAPFVINAIVSTTGQNAFNGRYTQEALEVFETYANRTGGINGRPIKFAFFDDQSNPEVAVQLLDTIKAQNVAVVLGSDAVAPCGAMAPLVLQEGPVMFCTSPGLDAPPDSFAFASTSSTKAYMASMVRYFRLRGWKRVALLMTTDVYDAGLAVPVATSGGNGNPQQLKALDAYMPPELLLGGLPEDLSPEQLGSSPIRRAIDDFRAAFQAAGMTPTPGTSPYVWDPAAIVLNAYCKLGTGASAKQIRDYIENLHGFVGMNGIYDFRSGDQHGVTVDSLVVLRWDPTTNAFHPATSLGGTTLPER